MKRVKWLALIVCCLLMATSVVVVAGGCGEEKTSIPNITELNPNSGVTGTQVKIIGTNFGDARGIGEVDFGNAESDIVSWSDTGIIAKVPATAAVGDQPVIVLTTSGGSNELPFTVTAPPKAPDRQESQIEHNTPVQAMTAFLNKHGISADGFTFSVYKVSAKDPNWKVDVGTKPGLGTLYFLLHKGSDGNWTCVDYGTVFTQQELSAEGAPTDIFTNPPPAPTPTPTPTPSPQPKSQQQVILEYMTANKIDTTNVTISLFKQSAQDPTWELFKISYPVEEQKAILYAVVHQENGQWVVKAVGDNVNSTAGLPADLKQ